MYRCIKLLGIRVHGVVF